MSIGRVFNESIFHSYANLQNFFYRSDAISKVLSNKDKPFSNCAIPLNSNLDGKWLVCQIATAPFRWILSIVLKDVSKISKFFGATEFAKQVKISSQLALAGFALCSEAPTKLFRIKATVNRPDSEGKIVNSTPLISQNRITDPKIEDRTFCSLYKGIKFNHKKGICRGMSQWFLYLYLKTMHQFSDPRRHMAALGKQFAKGGGTDPVLLQSIHLRKGKLLGMRIGDKSLNSPGNPCGALYHYKFEDYRSKPKLIERALQQLPPGAYEIHLPFHLTSYIKINDNLGFFFEPNYGITEINGSAVGQKLYGLIAKSLEETGETQLEKWRTLCDDVLIIPVKMRV